MKIKNALIFAGGLSIGIALSSAAFVNILLDSKHMRKALKDIVAEKFTNWLYGSDKPREEKKPEVTVKVDEIMFDSRLAAEKVLYQMIEIAKTKGFVSVYEYYELCGLKGTEEDKHYGWTSLLSATVINDHGKYKINLPTEIGF